MKTVLRLAPIVLVAVLLSGCISLFPKSKPAQLYRFGADFEAPAGAAATSGATLNVARQRTDFAQASRGDGILSVRGSQTAYIADSRWVTPAQMMFDEAVERAFEAEGPGVHIINRGETLHADVGLRLEVETFEARYDRDAPTVVVSVKATLTSPLTRSILAERTFTSRKPAGENRVSAIVAGFDAATHEVLSQIVAWTAAEGAKAPRG